MSTDNQRMSSININDIFHDLIDENRRLEKQLLFANKSLNFLIRFKIQLNYIFDKLNNKLDSEEVKALQELANELKAIFGEKQLDFNCFEKTKKIEDIIEENIGFKTEIDCNGSDGNEDIFEDNMSYKSENISQSDDEWFDPKPENTPNNGFNKRQKMAEKRRNITKEKVNKSIKMINKTNKHLKSDPNQSFFCPFFGCGKEFRLKQSLDSHYLFNHSTKSEPFVCDYNGCDYRTRRKQYFENHVNRHKGVKPYECNYPSCGKSFISNFTLKQHIDMCHNLADETLSCGLDNCQKVFNTELSLKKHQIICHSKKRFPCNEPNCDFMGKTRSLVNLHRLTHSTERPYHCTLCEKTYKRPSDLGEHMKAAHGTGRPCKCPVDGCNKAFKIRSTLRSHMQIHSVQKFSCEWPGCEYTSNIQCYVESHQLVHKSEKDLVCDWPECGKRFKGKQHLEAHLRIHRKDKRYACHWPGCSYRCTDSGNIQKHLKIHKNNS